MSTGTSKPDQRARRLCELKACFEYLEKVHDAGGWERYAQAHRKHLAAMFASKLGLPADVLFLVVDFWGAHVGMYAFDAGATKEEVENVEEHGRKSGPCTIS